MPRDPQSRETLLDEKVGDNDGCGGIKKNENKEEEEEEGLKEDNKKDRAPSHIYALFLVDK